jgi:hypothetical protein
VSQHALTARSHSSGPGCSRRGAHRSSDARVPTSIPLHALRPSPAASIPPARPNARTRGHGTVLLRAGRGRSGDCGLRRQGDRRLQHAHPLDPRAPAPPKVLPVGVRVHKKSPRFLIYARGSSTRGMSSQSAPCCNRPGVARRRNWLLPGILLQCSIER